MVILTRYDVNDPVFYFATDGTIKESVVKVIAIYTAKALSSKKVMDVILSVITQSKKADIDDAFVVQTEINYKIVGVPDDLFMENKLFASMDEALESIKLKQ